MYFVIADAMLPPPEGGGFVCFAAKKKSSPEGELACAA